MTDSRKDYTTIDDRLLNAQQAVKLWKLVPEEARHRYMNVLWEANPALHDEVLRLCEAAPSGNSRRADGARPAQGE